MRALALGLFVLSSLLAAPATTVDADRSAVEGVVRAAYVEGVHAHPDPAAMRKGFHPDFRMLIRNDSGLRRVTLDEWAERVGKAAAERKESGESPEIRAEFTSVDVTGDAATVRLELYRDGKGVYTDYLSLYRFAEGWRIVSKTFHSH